MFSTLFNLSQLILMGRSSTITICQLNGYAQKHITLFRYWGFWRTNQNILPDMELLICETVALVLVLCGELDHIQNSYMTCIVHTARIINEIDILAVRRRHVIHQPCIQPSSSRILGSSMVRASNRCTEGHRFNSCWRLRFFLCPMLVTC